MSVGSVVSGGKRRAPTSCVHQTSNGAAGADMERGAYKLQTSADKRRRRQGSSKAAAALRLLAGAAGLGLLWVWVAPFLNLRGEPSLHVTSSSAAAARLQHGATAAVSVPPAQQQPQQQQQQQQRDAAPRDIYQPPPRMLPGGGATTPEQLQQQAAMKRAMAQGRRPQQPRATPLPLLPADPAHIAEAAKVPLAPLPAAAARELRRLFDLAKSDKAALVKELERERVSEPDLRDLRVMEEFRGGRRDAFVYFQHMRKAGGTAFCDLAKRNMPTRQVPKYYCMSDRRGALASPPWSERDYLLSQMRQKGFRITANEWDALPRSTLTLPGAVFATMLRNPLDRWYSQYRFEHVEHRDGSPKNVTMPFERWYPRYAAGSQGHNYYVKAFTGEENPGAAALDTQRDKAGDPLYKKALLWSWRKFKAWGRDVEWDAFARAVDALRRFHLVLVTELMDGAGGLVEAALGWEQPPQLVRPHEKHAWRNGTAPSSARDSLSAAAWQDLAEANAFDLVLYHWARRLFLERMACETAAGAAAAADTESTAEAAADRAATAVAAAAAAAAAPTVDVYAAPALPWKAADIDARGSGAVM